jgi:hypothetical protein
MQKWRPRETANEVQWGQAVERASVIRPLAEDEKAHQPMLRLGLSPTLLKIATAVSTTSARVYQNFVFGLSATRAGSPRFK